MSISKGPGAQLETLIAKQEIAEILQRYSRTLDWVLPECPLRQGGGRRVGRGGGG